jgi:hypothetical protein
MHKASYTVVYGLVEMDSRSRTFEVVDEKRAEKESDKRGEEEGAAESSTMTARRRSCWALATLGEASQLLTASAYFVALLLLAGRPEHVQGQPKAIG